MALWRTTLACVVVTSVLAWSATLVAQETGEHGQGMHAGAGMMAGMAQAFAPATLLEQRERLDLTEEQVARLTEIQREAHDERDRALATHDSHRSKLREALTAWPLDPNTVRTHFDAAHAAMGLAHWLTIDAAIRATAVLTDLQRDRVRGGIGQEGAGPAMGRCMHGRCGHMQAGQGPEQAGGDPAAEIGRAHV